MEHGVILGVPSFSCLLFRSFLLWISAQYIWHRHRLLPSPDTSQVEVEFRCVPYPQNGYHTVLIGCGTYGFLRLRMLNGYLIDFFTSQLLYRFMQPRGSAPKVGDNIMAQLNMPCPGPGNTRSILSARHEP
jgi:hypothetical protein